MRDANDLQQMLGRHYRVGDAVDATVVAFTKHLDGGVQIKVSWWHDNKRNEEWVTPPELGAELMDDKRFGFGVKQCT